MPVPVPRISRSPAHPVVKKRTSSSSQDGFDEQSFSFTVPVSPRGPPPSFGTREQWINSLPTWRRTKHRRIWEDDEPAAAPRFLQGLAFADTASAIKGPRADACSPPLYQMVAPKPDAAASHLPSHLTGGSEHEAQMAGHQQGMALAQNAVGMAVDEETYERGAFTPVFEDDSSFEGGDGVEVHSSPLQPATPVTEFTDRHAAVVFDPYSGPVPDLGSFIASGMTHQSGSGEYEAHPVYQQAADLPKEPAPAPATGPEVTPTATAGYRKLAEPLSEWVANIVWKLCTVHVQVPSDISRVMYASPGQYLASPPSHLAVSVHSVLLSTLLQPSAVFLAIWYIARLPAYFGVVKSLNGKELLFRSALFGDGSEQDTAEASSPFRLVVLGCMLANKWLDDHTFSNKTWHTISNINIRVLNQLEMLALDLFSYDLSISAADWGRWLQDITAYHVSLTTRPQPIGRPSTNPHSIVRKALDEIFQAPAACGFDSARPQPVFIGLEERKRAQQEREEALARQSLQIDLDADGPLRAEYVPKRRISVATSTFGRVGQNEKPLADYGDQNRFGRDNVEKGLPPPARWSPAADEPILRERNRTSNNYVPVQPPAMHYGSYVSSYSYAPNVWQVADPYPGMNVKPLQPMPYVLNAPVMHHLAPAYNPCPMYMPMGDSHARSLSYGHEQDPLQTRQHSRSYSQNTFEYRCSDLRTTAYELPPPPKMEPQWPAHYGYGGGAPAFGPFPAAGYQTAWIRT